MDSKFRERLERLGPVRDAVPARSSSAPLVPIVLRGIGPLDRLVSVARRLFNEGTSMRAAHTAINELAEHGRTVFNIPGDTDFDALARDLRVWNVDVLLIRSLLEDAALEPVGPASPAEVGGRVA